MPLIQPEAKKFAPRVIYEESQHDTYVETVSMNQKLSEHHEHFECPRNQESLT